MIPVDQTQFFAPPDNAAGDPGKVGNCFAACIASILEMDLKDVPNFCAHSREEWWPKTIEWLRPFGLTLVGWDRAYDEIWAPDVWSILTGKSPRGAFDHSVVGRGVEIAHDPHPSRDGFDGVIKRVEVFVAIDPAVSATEAIIEIVGEVVMRAHEATR